MKIGGETEGKSVMDRFGPNNIRAKTKKLNAKLTFFKVSNLSWSLRLNTGSYCFQIETADNATCTVITRHEKMTSIKGFIAI